MGGSHPLAPVRPTYEMAKAGVPEDQLFQMNKYESQMAELISARKLVTAEDIARIKFAKKVDMALWAQAKEDEKLNRQRQAASDMHMSILRAQQRAQKLEPDVRKALVGRLEKVRQALLDQVKQAPKRGQEIAPGVYERVGFDFKSIREMLDKVWAEFGGRGRMESIRKEFPEVDQLLKQIEFGMDPVVVELNNSNSHLASIEGNTSDLAKAIMETKEGIFGLVNEVLGNKPKEKKASGGMISGPGGPKEDKVPIWASPGEYVIPADVTKKHLKELKYLTEYGEFPKFQSGGLVEEELARPRPHRPAATARVARMLDREGMDPKTRQMIAYGEAASKGMLSKSAMSEAEGALGFKHYGPGGGLPEGISGFETAGGKTKYTNVNVKSKGRGEPGELEKALEEAIAERSKSYTRMAQRDILLDRGIDEYTRKHLEMVGIDPGSIEPTKYQRAGLQKFGPEQFEKIIDKFDFVKRPKDYKPTLTPDPGRRGLFGSIGERAPITDMMPGSPAFSGAGIDPGRRGLFGGKRPPIVEQVPMPMFTLPKGSVNYGGLDFESGINKAGRGLGKPVGRKSLSAKLREVQDRFNKDVAGGIDIKAGGWDKLGGLLTAFFKPEPIKPLPLPKDIKSDDPKKGSVDYMLRALEDQYSLEKPLIDPTAAVGGVGATLIKGTSSFGASYLASVTDFGKASSDLISLLGLDNVDIFKGGLSGGAGAGAKFSKFAQSLASQAKKEGTNLARKDIELVMDHIVDNMNLSKAEEKVLSQSFEEAFKTADSYAEGGQVVRKPIRRETISSVPMGDQIYDAIADFIPFLNYKEKAANRPMALMEETMKLADYLIPGGAAKKPLSALGKGTAHSRAGFAGSSKIGRGVFEEGLIDKAKKFMAGIETRVSDLNAKTGTSLKVMSDDFINVLTSGKSFDESAKAITEVFDQIESIVGRIGGKESKRLKRIGIDRRLVDEYAQARGTSIDFGEKTFLDPTHIRKAVSSLGGGRQRIRMDDPESNAFRYLLSHEYGHVVSTIPNKNKLRSEFGWVEDIFKKEKSLFKKPGRLFSDPLSRYGRIDPLEYTAESFAGAFHTPKSKATESIQGFKELYGINFAEGGEVGGSLLGKLKGKALEIYESIFGRSPAKGETYSAFEAGRRITENEKKKHEAIAEILGEKVPQYATGSAFIPEDQLAMLHRGERVVPARDNTSGSVMREVLKSGEKIGEKIKEALEDTKLTASLESDTVKVSNVSEISDSLRNALSGVNGGVGADMENKIEGFMTEMRDKLSRQESMILTESEVDQKIEVLETSAQNRMRNELGSIKAEVASLEAKIADIYSKSEKSVDTASERSRLEAKLHDLMSEIKNGEITPLKTDVNVLRYDLNSVSREVNELYDRLITLNNRMDLI